MPHESARLSTIAPDHGGFSLPKQGQADQAGPQPIAQTRAYLIRPWGCYRHFVHKTRARAYLSGKLTFRGPPQTTANRCAAKVAHHCLAVNSAGKHKFFANGMGRGVQSGPPFFFRYPPRPSAFETPKGRICCATLATGTTSPNPGSRYPAQPASTHPAPPGFAAYLLRSIRKRPVFSGYLIGYQPFGYRLFAANLSANQIPANPKKAPFRC